MSLNEVIAQIDAEIAKLQQAKILLSGSAPAVKSRRGRPKGSNNAVKIAAPVATKPKRKLTPEGRSAIANAMKKRWADADKRKIAEKTAAK